MFSDIYWNVGLLYEENVYINDNPIFDKYLGWWSIILLPFWLFQQLALVKVLVSWRKEKKPGSIFIVIGTLQKNDKSRDIIFLLVWPSRPWKLQVRSRFTLSLFSLSFPLHCIQKWVRKKCIFAGYQLLIEVINRIRPLWSHMSFRKKYIQAVVAGAFFLRIKKIAWEWEGMFPLARWHDTILLSPSHR